MNMQNFSDILKVVLQVAQVVALVYAAYKFTQKPHDTLEAKHIALEKKVEEHDVVLKQHAEALNHGKDNFREQKDTNELMIRSIFALIAYEIDYCYKEGKSLSPELNEIHEELKRYLARK